MKGYHMQNEITEKQKLLDDYGHLANPGYAKRLLFEYSRQAIKASGWRIKEWDYYATLNDDYGISVTIADLSYSAMISAVFFDFKQKICFKKTKLLWFTFGKLKMPESSETGNVIYDSKGYHFEFIRNDKERKLNATIKDFLPKQDLHVELILDDLKDESMVIATPWKDKPKAFYYNQKINCMPTSGTVKIGEKVYSFDKKNSFSVLDWGRGVWTYKNTWYWGSASGLVAGKRFGFNIGYGFGDTTKASENMIFYEGKAHKFDRVQFIIDQNDYLKPWKFTSNDHRFEMVLEPIIDRQDTMNVIIIKNLGHQVFGKYYGFAILDDGTKIEVDGLLGFAEQITNHY
ncbi:MAG: DUF2804 domain-containing protein [Candidatus Izemoplasmatales bacterium]|jgi:hypothetical protein